MRLSRKLHPSVSVLLFSLGVITGTIILCFLRPTCFGSVLWLVLAVALLIFAILFPHFPFVFLALFSGFLMMAWRMNSYFAADHYYHGITGQTITLAGRVAKDPDKSDSGKLNLTLIDTETSASIFTQVDANLDVERSDIVTITGAISDGFGTYAASIFRPTVENIEKSGDIFLKIREFFAEKIKKFIPEPQSGLSIGYLLGQKSGVDKSFQEALRAVGLTHIIVASGAHLSTLTGFARKIFGKISRFASLFFAILLTLFFIGITGLSASMVRAGLVTGLSLLLWYFGRKMQPLRLIIIVASWTLIYNPAYILDLAWQLSFAAFTAIMVLAPMITKFFYGKSRQPNFVFSTLISSFAAALLCSPIQLYYFGQISLITIFANLLVLPTVSIAMGMTFLTGIFAIFLEPVAAIFGQIATWILNYQIAVVNFFSEQKLFEIQVETGNLAVFLLYIPLMVVLLICAWYSKFKLHKTRVKV